jgi:NADPH-dependent 2,4-dienoyl-CoA reductase/sulfur reductase-like enzyme
VALCFGLVADFAPWISAPKGLFPPEPEAYTGPKLKVAVIGSGLAGMSTAVELLEQGHEVLPLSLCDS